MCLCCNNMVDERMIFWNFLLVVMFGGRFGGRHNAIDEVMDVQVLCSQGPFTFKYGGNDDVCFWVLKSIYFLQILCHEWGFAIKWC